MADDNTYQPKVYMKQGGNTQVVKSDGSFQFYNTDCTGTKLQNFFLSFQTHTDYYRSGAVSFFNVSQMPVAYGFHCWSGNTTMSLGSVTLAVPDSGCVLYLDGTHLIGDGNLSVLISGITMINMGSVALSSFEISAMGWARLVCLRANEWAVVEGNILEHLD
jgi:hypothetical protein